MNRSRMIPRIRHLILDFDETLTPVDTISLLTSAAYRLRPTTLPLLPPWNYFTESWLDDYNRHAQSYTHPRRTIDEECRFLASLVPVERASIRRIEKAGVFAGLRTADLAHAAEETVTVRPDFWWVCELVLDAGGRVSVLSVNWSKEWIRSALGAAVARECHGGEKERARFEHEVVVASNSFCSDGVTTTGEITRSPELGNDRGIWTAPDKAAMMEILVGEGVTEGPVVYVGDSSTDIMCLLRADVGVVIGNKLDETCRRFGIELVDQFTGICQAKSGQKKLYKVHDLAMLGRWIRRQ